MKKGEIGEGIVREVQFSNKGIVVTEDGEQVIVKDVIEGQKVKFRINKKRKGKTEATLIEILQKSDKEIGSPCVHFGACGGCNYQTLPYEEQLALKEGQVRNLMENAIGDSCQYEFLGIQPSPCQFSYRNKMEFTFGDEYKDGPLALGMHKRGGFYDLVTVDRCCIVDEDFQKILKTTLNFFSKHEITYYHRLQHTGYLRHLLVRKAKKTGEILVDLITTTQGEITLQTLENWAKELLALDLDGKMKGILHTSNDCVADAVKNEGTEVLFGEDYFYEELLGLRFRITPFSFFQTNSLGAEVLYRTARDFVLGSYSDGDAVECATEGSLNNATNGSVSGAVRGSVGQLQNATVYDLYSGTGTIAQLMAPVCKRVVGVEIVEEAVEAAKENAKLNGLANCEFLAGDVLKVLNQIEEKPDYIILDPPRDGVHPKALEKILAYGVEHMVYISCKPTSLARDLEIFLANGYVVEKIACVDLFPGTVHVETIALLSRKSGKF